MFRLVWTSLRRRPLRSSLTVSGVAAAVAVILLVDRLGVAYQGQLLKELNSMGQHLMVVPLGCPYDAAARVLKGATLETSLPGTAAVSVRSDPDVDLAAPLLIGAVARPREGRTDLFVGLDESGMALKRWWKAARGQAAFPSPDALVLGADAAQAELREPGDSFYSPELQREFRVAGVLERSGTSDDNLFFVPLPTAQAMFHSSNRITAVAVRLRDPAKLGAVSARLKEIPGAQVVTQTEMMGTFLNILGAVRTLLQSVTWVAAAASVAGLVNTLVMSVAERKAEFSLFRALGASRRQLFAVISLESLLLTAGGMAGGIVFCDIAAAVGARFAPGRIPVMPLVFARPEALALAIGLGIAAALLASLFPAWQAMRADPAAVLKGGE